MKVSFIFVLFWCFTFDVFGKNKDWYLNPIEVWEPPFNKIGSKKTLESYKPLGKVSKKWRICVAIPHLKDAYWEAVNFGLVRSASDMGISLNLFEAGGYENLSTQRQQLKKCLQDNYDGLIISSISKSGINDILESFHQKNIPIIDLINGVNFPDVSAKVGASYYDMARLAGQYLRKSSEGHKVKVLWFPGPKNAAWVSTGHNGFLDALKGSQIEILDTYYGDTGRVIQKRLVQKALKDHNDVQFIVGTSVTAESAVTLLRNPSLKKRNLKILSYYYSPGVHKGIQRGDIIAAPTDMQAVSARISIDTMIRVLEQKPYEKHLGPKIQIVDSKSIIIFDGATSLAPRGFRTIFSVN